MDSERGLLVACIVIVIVVLFNAGLIFSLTSPGTREQLRMLTRLAMRTREPMLSQTEELAELRDRVSKLGDRADDEGDGVD